MYDNIGRKLKDLATGIFIIEAIGAVIGGIVLVTEEYFVWGLLTIIFGPIVAWFSSWLLYAFGELVEDVSRLRKHFIPDETPQKFNTPPIEVKKATCEFCGKSNAKLNTYKNKSTLGSGDAEMQLCDKCAKENNLI